MSLKTEHGVTGETVTLRHWLKLLVAYLTIPLTLFLSAGDMRWWEAWAYSFLVISAGLGGRVWAERRHPGLTAERQNPEIIRSAKPWDKVLAPLMALSIGYPTVLVAGLDHRFNWSTGFPLWLTATGFALLSGGYAFAAWAFAENRFFYSIVCVQTGRGHQVCDSGPYAFLRHPGYAGNILGLGGIVLALGSVWAVIPAAVASFIALARTALEDKALMAELPGYTDYAGRVRYRLLPLIY